MPVLKDFRIVDDFYIWEAYQGINNARTVDQFRIVDNYYLYLAILGLAGHAGTYKSYVALLSQAGAAAPVAVVLQNSVDTVNPITLGRLGNGSYTVNSSGKFTANKTFVLITKDPNGPTVMRGSRFSDNVILLDLMDTTTATEVDNFSSASLEIRVYP